MQIRVLAFARIRELVDAHERSLELPAGASVADAWRELVRTYPALDTERDSTRAACNGRLVGFEQPLSDGDELALLPPVGGG